MFEFAMIAEAYVGAVESYHRQKQDAVFAERERQMEAWEDEHLLPLMEPERAQAFLAERVRLKERKADIKRQEAQHRERMAVENRKAAALEESARSDRLGMGLALGWFIGKD